MVDSGPCSGPGLLRYFKPCRKDSCQISLPNPTGILSEKVDNAAIEEANKKVTAAVIAGTGSKQGISIAPYERSLDYCCLPEIVQYI